ncbi:hypothetical protein V6N13_115315 [Hibiscus sabdariffa]
MMGENGSDGGDWVGLLGRWRCIGDGGGGGGGGGGGEGREKKEGFWSFGDDMGFKNLGKLSNGMVVCDVSGSMNGMPMEVSVALGVLLSDLSKAPWKGEGYYLKSDIEIDRSIVRLHGRLTLQIKFWNLKDSGSTPVPATRKGVALVLGPRW